MTAPAFLVDNELSSLVVELFAAGARRAGRHRRVQPSRGRMLGGRAPVLGSGYVAAVGYLADEPWWLEWFTQGEDGRSHRMVCQTDPDGVGFFDYEFLTWYVVPRETGRRHVTGPYIDYLCTDDYNMTFTAPVVIGERFAGVARCRHRRPDGRDAAAACPPRGGPAAGRRQCAGPDRREQQRPPPAPATS